MTFTDRRNVVTTAIDLVNAAIPYPSTFLQIPVCIVYFGGSFDGTIPDISNIRCDGFVEYCYEKNNLRIWRNQDYVDSAWSIVLYPDLNNDRRICLEILRTKLRLGRSAVRLVLHVQIQLWVAITCRQTRR